MRVHGFGVRFFIHICPEFLLSFEFFILFEAQSLNCVVLHSYTGSFTV